MSGRHKPLLPAVLAALDGFDLTAPQIAERIGGTRANVDINLRKVEGVQAHIVDYQRQRHGPPTPIWTIGPGVSKQRPRRKSDAERARRYIRKHAGLVKARKAKAEGRLNHYAQLMQN